jgi:hypothetical protein
MKVPRIELGYSIQCTAVLPLNYTHHLKLIKEIII